MTTKPKSSMAGYGCATLFVAPFGLIGLYMLGLSFWMTLEWVLVNQWIETAATLQSVSLRETRNEGTTYRVVANYEYERQGNTFTAERVGMDDRSDNIGSYHQQLYSRLKPLEGMPNGTACFVNPSNPADAVLVRDARWELFAFYSTFATVFGSIGVLGTVLMRRMHRAEVADADRAIRHPNEPWKWKSQWQDGRVHSNQDERSRRWTEAAIWWAVATAPTACFSLRALANGVGWAAVGLIPPAIALWIINHSRRYRSFSRDFGSAYLDLPEVPLYPGYAKTLAVVFSDGNIPQSTVKSHLYCNAKSSDDDGDSNWKKEHEDHQLIERDDCRMIADGLCIAVPVNIPQAGLPTTTDDDSIEWKLSVSVPTRRKPFNVEFVLPVFTASDTSEQG